MSIPLTNQLNTQMTAATSTDGKPLVLNEGQMVHGKVNQLFPGQLAEVQIGGHKMIAKLDVPMRAGDSYYFQVTGTQPEVQLKIISGPTNATADQQQQLQNLMQAMQLPKSPEMMKVLSFVIDQKMPISREALLQAVKILEGVPSAQHPQALASIQKLVELKLPITLPLFQALFNVGNKGSTHQVLQALQNVLQNDQTVSENMKQSLMQTMQRLESPLTNRVATSVIGQALQSMMNQDEAPEVKFTMLQTLKEAGVLPKNASLANLQSLISTTLAKEAGIQSMQAQFASQTPLTNAQLTNVQQFLNQLNIFAESEQVTLLNNARQGGMAQLSTSFMQLLGGHLAKNPVALNGAVTQFLQSLNSEQSTPLPTQMTQLVQLLEQNEQPVLRQMMVTAQTAVAETIDGAAVKETIQTVFRSLGVNYEASLAGKDVQPERLMQMLKPQLLALLQDPTVSATVKEAAEQAVIRMNGAPLLSADNGVQQQLIMQIPLTFFERKIDATLQWSGRKKEDGKIDADYARILFYLDLASIKETVVDMQVQNRVVTVTIFNEDPTLARLSSTFEPILKENLTTVGYTLSGIFFKNYMTPQTTAKKTTQQPVQQGEGVDFRI